MTRDELLSRVKELAGEDFASLAAQTQTEIESLYTSITGRKFRKCNCRDRYRDAVFEMYSTLKKTIRMTPKTKYRLKKGVVFDYNGITYSNENLTDEVAKVVSKQFPKRFEFIPEEEEPKVAPVVEAQPEEVQEPQEEKPRKMKVE